MFKHRREVTVTLYEASQIDSEIGDSQETGVCRLLGLATSYFKIQGLWQQDLNLCHSTVAC